MLCLNPSYHKWGVSMMCNGLIHIRMGWGNAFSDIKVSLSGFSDSHLSVCVGRLSVYDDCDCTVLCVYDQMPLNFWVVERMTRGIINGQGSGGNFMGFLFVPAFQMGGKVILDTSRQFGGYVNRRDSSPVCQEF